MFNAPNEINQWLTPLKIGGYAHLDYEKRSFFEDKHNQSWIKLESFVQ